MKRICANAEDMADQAAALFIEEAAKAIATKGLFRAALSGGSTPKRLYEKLAEPERARAVDWAHVQLFWGDERFVPQDDPLSNYAMTKAALLDAVPLPAANVFPVPFAPTSEESARLYEEKLRTVFDALPVFDLTLLGLGADGHTASLFPGNQALQETTRWTSPARPLAGGPERITLTFPVLNASHLVCFLAAGGEKAEIVREILTGPQGRYPAQNIAPTSGRLVWFLDQESARFVA